MTPDKLQTQTRLNQPPQPTITRIRPAAPTDLQWIQRHARELADFREHLLRRDGRIFDAAAGGVVEIRRTPENRPAVHQANPIASVLRDGETVASVARAVEFCEIGWPQCYEVGEPIRISSREADA